MERLPCNKYLFFFLYIFFKDLLNGAFDVCDTYYMGRETWEKPSAGVSKHTETGW